MLLKCFVSGVLWSNGDSWKEMRRFALINLRNYGMGKKACEDKIIEESHYLTEVIEKFKGKCFLGNHPHNRQHFRLQKNHAWISDLRGFVWLLFSFLFLFAGEAFDTTKPMNYAVSNIICSMVYGSRFEYDDPEFTSIVDRNNRNIQLAGSPAIQVSFNKFMNLILAALCFKYNWSINSCNCIELNLNYLVMTLRYFKYWCVFVFLQLYNLFPWIGKWISDRKEFHKLADANKKQNLELFSRLKETLNPQMCRGLVDSFLVHKQHLEVGKALPIIVLIASK